MLIKVLTLISVGGMFDACVRVCVRLCLSLCVCVGVCLCMCDAPTLMDT